MRRALSFGSIAVVVVACSTLPDIPRGTCGNHVLEKGEDCDGTAPDGSACRAPGQPNACRFDCSAGDNGAAPACPSGWGCGADGICRGATGAFTALSPSIASSATSVGLADYDGDGLADVREVGQADIRIRFGDAAGDLSQSFLISVSNAHPVAGQLTGDKLLDLAFASTEELAVWRGETDRTLTPTTYPTIPLPPNAPLAFVTAEVIRPRTGLEVVVFLSDPLGNGFNLSVRGGDELDATATTPLFLLKQGPGDLVAPLIAGRFDEDPVNSPCDEILAVFKGAHEVNVLPTCRGDLANTTGPGHRTLPPLTLPSDIAIQNVFILDANKDGHLDIFAISDENRTFTAFGLGDGTFAPPIEDTSVLSALGTPIAVGFINDDNILDFVTTDAIIIFQQIPTAPGPDGSPGDGGIEAKVFPAPTGVNWSEAHILDINGNGKPDVVCASPRRIDFYNGTGTALLDPTFYRIDGTPGLFSFGDFDGDLATDIAFREHFESGPDGLSVMFGAQAAFPSPAVSEGRIGTISVVSGGPISNDDPLVLNDGIADIGVLAKATDGQSQFVSILTGSADRLLQSPFVLTRNKDRAGRQVPFPSAAFGFAVGQFTNDPALGDPHPDIAVAGVELESGKSDKVQSGELHMWLVPVTGEAVIDPSKVTASALVENLTFDTTTRAQTAGLDWVGQQASMTALDLDGVPKGGVDELLAIVPPVAESQKPGALFVFKVDGGAFNQPQRVSIGFDAPFVAPWTLRRADVNADGAIDVLAVYGDKPGMTARVYMNQKNGSLDPTPLGVPLPDGASLVAATTLNADQDTQLEVALLTSAGVFIADLAAEGNHFTVGAKPVLATTGNSIAAGDVNGDGLDDLAISGAGVVQVFKGVPVLP
jgi:hypothetical protein